MELIPHFRVVRFSPVPECVEAVNVAVLILDSHPRLVSDFQFEKLACVAPSFNPEALRVWLESAAEEIKAGSIDDITQRLTARTAQIELSRQHFIGRDVPRDLEENLIDVFLKKQRRLTKQSEPHIHYVETLIQAMIEPANIQSGRVLKRAKPENFLRSESLKLLTTPSIRFARVIDSPRSLVIMDGLNLAVTSRSQLRQRASEIGIGFYSFGDAKREIENIEQKKIVRTAFVFNRPTDIDTELAYYIEQVSRESDVRVDSSVENDVLRFQQLLHEKSSLV